MKLVAGLGNPRAEYERTRHNAGFRVVDAFSASSGIKLAHRKHSSVFGRGRFRGEDVILAKPVTYVNLSGRAVKSLVRYYRVAPEDILVVYDDMDIPFGRLRIKAGGGSAGHRGVESVIGELRTELFPRLRIGIGSGAERGKGFVLGRFSREEEKIFSGVVADAARAVESVLIEGLAPAMNRFNPAHVRGSGESPEDGDEGRG